jgi:hypothetical protein
MAGYWTTDRLSEVFNFVELSIPSSMIGSLRAQGDDLVCQAGALKLVTSRYYDDGWVTAAFRPGENEGQLLAFEDTPGRSLLEASKRNAVRDALAAAIRGRLFGGEV